MVGVFVFHNQHRIDRHFGRLHRFGGEALGPRRARLVEVTVAQFARAFAQRQFAPAKQYAYRTPAHRPRRLEPLRGESGQWHFAGGHARNQIAVRGEPLRGVHEQLEIHVGFAAQHLHNRHRLRLIHAEPGAHHAHPRNRQFTPCAHLTPGGAQRRGLVRHDHARDEVDGRTHAPRHRLDPAAVALGPCAHGVVCIERADRVGFELPLGPKAHRERVGPAPLHVMQMLLHAARDGARDVSWRGHRRPQAPLRAIRSARFRGLCAPPRPWTPRP